MRRGSTLSTVRGFSTGRLPSTFCEGYHDAELVKKMPYRPLGKRCVDKQGRPMEVSVFSLGATSFAGMYGQDADWEECLRACDMALRSGVNLIDTAAWYGHGKSEAFLGEALKNVPRDAYYLNTKVCRYNPDVLTMFDWSYARTLEAIDEALDRLQVDYIDSIQVHDPEYCPDLDLVIDNVFPAFLEAKKQGKVRQLGVTGYPLPVLREQIEKAEAKGIEIDTCLSYSHYCLHDTSLTELIPFLQERGIGLIGASPMSMGLITERGPPDWHPATEPLRGACREAAEYCKQQGVDIGRIAIQFALMNESIPTILNSTHSETLMEKNLKAVWELGKLTDRERDALDYVLKNIFEPNPVKDWVGVEAKTYFALLKRAQAGEKVGTISTSKIKE